MYSFVIIFPLRYLKVLAVSWLDLYLCMMRGERWRRICIVKSKVVVWEQILNTLQVRQARSTSSTAPTAYQPLVLGQALDLWAKKSETCQ